MNTPDMLKTFRALAELLLPPKDRVGLTLVILSPEDTCKTTLSGRAPSWEWFVYHPDASANQHVADGAPRPPEPADLARTLLDFLER